MAGDTADYSDSSTPEAPESIQQSPPPVPTVDQNTDTPINLTPPEQQQAPTINLVDNTTPTTLTPDGQDQRASMAHYALQEKSPGIANLKQVIATGNEPMLRQTATFDQVLKQNQITMSLVKDIAGRRGEDLSDDEQASLTKLVQNQSAAADPNTVLEKLWANNYVQELLTTPAQAVAEGVAAAPAQTLNIAGHTDQLVAKHQIFNSLKQEYDKKWEDTPYFTKDFTIGRVDAWLRSAVPGMDEYSLHNVAKGSEDFTTTVLPGGNLNEVRDFIYLLPPERAASVARAATEELWRKSPLTAMKFLDAITNRPNSAEWVDNLQGVADVATVIPGGLLSRGAKATANATERLISRAPVQITEELAKAGENIVFDPKQIQELLEKGTIKYKGIREDSTARGMTSIELRKAQEAFPEEGGYPPTSNYLTQPVSSVGPPGGIQEGGVNGYRIGESKFPVKPDSKFISTEDAEKLTPGTRIFQNSNDELALTRQVEGKWTPTGDTISPTNTPEPGQVALDLGSEKNSMGSLYYDNHSTSEPITALDKTAGTVTQPYQMGIRDIDRIRDGLPSQALSPTLDFTKFREAASNVKISQARYDDARRALDDIEKAGDPASIEAQKARVAQFKSDVDNALQARNTTSVYTNHPAIDRAQQGLRSYMSSAFRALKEVPSATGTGIKADIQGSLTTLGRIDDAVKAGAMRKVQETVNAADDPALAVESMGKDLPSLLRPNPSIENSSSLSREGVARVSDAMIKRSLALQGALQGNRVQRLTAEDLKTAYNSTAQQVKDLYSTDFNNALLDQKRTWHPEVNEYHVESTLGKADATGFDTEHSARNTARMVYKIPDGDFFIKQEGDSFFIQTSHPIDERESVLNKPIPTNNVTPQSPVNIALGNIRTAEDTTSALQRSARHVATHAPQELKAVIMDVIKSTNLGKTERGQLRELLDQSRLDFDSQGRMGKWYDITELETEYGKRYGSMPSEAFVDGYYTFKMLHDFDYQLRAYQLHSTVTRWGGKNFTFKVFDNEGMKDSDQFMGRLVDSIDNSQQRNRGFLLVDSADKTVTQHFTADLKGDLKDQSLVKNIKDKVDNGGYEIIQLFSPLKKPLKDSTGQGGDIYYVITNTAEKKNINFGEGLDYREGTHVAYTHPNFLKQAMITTDTKGQPVYAGDKTFRSGGSTEAESRAWATKYDTARNLMNSGDDAALDSYLRNNLPESLKDFKKLFTGPNALDKDMEIAHTTEGKNVFQSNPELQKKYAGDSGKLKRYDNDFSNPEAQLNSAYLQERADQPLMVAKDLGADIPDRFRLDTAPMLDPYLTLNRALGQAVRSRFMDDYKVLAAESFVKEFGQFIPDATTEALQRNPVHFLMGGKIDTGAEATTKAAFMQFQRNVQSFIGMQSKTGEVLAHFESKMQDSLYNRLGSDVATKVLENKFVSSVLIPAIKDPFVYARSVAFNERIGLFNPIQLWVQSQGLSNVLAIAPTSGLNGFSVASYMRLGGRYALDDPAKLERYASMISKTSTWNKDDVKEAFQAYKDSGISRVAGETAWRDDFLDPKFFQSKLGNFLDKGTVFFQAGERLVRDTAFFTAFHEWKKLNPGRVFDQYGMGEVMNRYDTLSLNMTRASNSSLQQGALSVPMQFLTFNQRQAEQLLGSRLTRAEKARVTLMYATLYGIPTGLGAWGAVQMPLVGYDDIRTEALKRGYDVDNKYFQAMHDGIMSTLFTAVTGKNTDLATRWGPGPSSISTDITKLLVGNTNDSSKTMGDLVFGPAGNTVKEGIKSMYPFWKYVSGTVTGDKYPLTIEDFQGLTQQIATLNNAQKFWTAYNVGKYMSKKGTYIGDVNGWDGFLMATMGLTPRKYQDDFLKQSDLSSAKQNQDHWSKFMQVEYTKGTELMAQGDITAATQHFSKADAMAKIADMTPETQGQAFFKSGQGQTSLHDQLNSRMFNDPRQSMQDQKLTKILKDNP